jgi:isoleucyl-tRNA synthetase
MEDLDPAYRGPVRGVTLYANYAGRYVKNAYDDSLTGGEESLDVDLCVMLKQQGLVFRIEKHVHNYPHCWRTDKPVLYYPLDSWFIRTTACLEQMMSLNDTSSGNLSPPYRRLERGWRIFRTETFPDPLRAYPLPIWRTSGRRGKCNGSMEELMSDVTRHSVPGDEAHPFPDFVPEIILRQL